MGIKRFAMGAVGGVPGLIIAGATSILNKTLNFITGDVPALKELVQVAKPKNWIPYAIGAFVVMMFIMPNGIGKASPVVTQQIVMPQFLDGENFQGQPAGDILDCIANPDNPACDATPCDPSSQNCAIPVDCGCYSQGPGDGFSHAGYNAVDMGFGKCTYPPYPPVTVTHDGVVVKIVTGHPPGSGSGSSPPSYGNYVVVQANDTDTRNGKYYQTLYGHLATVMVSRGQRVTRGTVIGLGDQTGRSTGPHLHYEIRYGSSPQSELNVFFPANPTSADDNILSFLPPRGADGCWRR
jgi:hypothetical protein